MEVRAGRSSAEVAAFVEGGIASDCPVAFLNLHEGQATGIQGWHWIALTGIRNEEGRHIASGLDEGRKIEFDLGRWVATTRSGGGFVYVVTR